MSEGWSATLSPRSNKGRFLLLILIMAFEIETFAGDSWNVFFLYIKKMLTYQVQDFTRLMLITGIISLAGIYVFLPIFVRKFKFHDATIALIGRYHDIFYFRWQYTLIF